MYTKDTMETIDLLICIDDTDNLETKGTGHLAEELRTELEKKFDVVTNRITRHQLFVNDKIPYTSHNSTMCFTAITNEKHYEEIIKYSSSFLKSKKAEGSDPGLCIAKKEYLIDIEMLIDFGRRATHSVLTKEEAYSLAKQLGIHLSEHGGTGDGIIGALAGIGLRLTGNHGRFRGGLVLNDNDTFLSAGELCEKYEVDEVRNTDSEKIENLEIIFLEGKVKTVLLDNKSVLPVKAVKNNPVFTWTNLSAEEVKKLFP